MTTTFSCDSVDHEDGHATLNFGHLFGTRPEFKVTTGLLGTNAFLFNPSRDEYTELAPSLVQTLKLSECRNRSEVPHQILAGGMNLEQFIEAGYDYLGYVTAVSQHPWLAGFQDNPGLFAILCTNAHLITEAQSRTLSRPRLLGVAIGSNLVFKRHIRLLSKVTLPKLSPSRMSSLLTNSLLWECKKSTFGTHEAEADTIRKFIYHQSAWTEAALNHLASILNDPAIDCRKHLKALNYLNKPGKHHYKHRYFEHLGGLVDCLEKAEEVANLLPGIFFEKLKCFVKSPSDDRIRRTQQMKAAIVRNSSEQCATELLRLVIEDSDIARPRIAPSNAVVHLDTCEKLQRHALAQSNCLWSPQYIAMYLARKKDIYELSGRSLISISVDRSSRDIDQMQAKDERAIHPEDLQTIRQWYSEATSLNAS